MLINVLFKCSLHRVEYVWNVTSTTFSCFSMWYIKIVNKDSIVRIDNDNYQIYIEQLVKYPEQTEEYIETGVKESGEKVNPEDLFSYVE